jgi:hypothetical protein
LEWPGFLDLNGKRLSRDTRATSIRGGFLIAGLPGDSSRPQSGPVIARFRQAGRDPQRPFVQNLCQGGAARAGTTLSPNDPSRFSSRGNSISELLAGAFRRSRFHLTALGGIIDFIWFFIVMDTRMGSVAGLKHNKGKLGILAVYILLVFWQSAYLLYTVRSKSAS